MQKPPRPDNEQERLQALIEHEILDTTPEEAFDKLTRMASKICGTQFAAISIIDKDRQWFKSKVGFDAIETPRDVSFCAHAILNQEITEIPNAQADVRFSGNPSVTEEPKIRFYASAPLLDSQGFAIGTLCVFDPKIKVLEGSQKEALQTFANQIIKLIEKKT